VSLLMDISREHTRVVKLGLTPIILEVDAKTKAILFREIRDVLSSEPGKSLMSMELRDKVFIGDGVFRVLTDDKTWKEL